MGRHPLALALPWAAFKDAVRVGATVVSVVAVGPSLCALVGHRDRAVASPDPMALCVRCGRTRAH